MAVAALIAASAERVVEAGGFEWRVVKVSNESLLTFGASVVDFLDIRAKREIVAEAKEDPATSSDAITRRLADNLNAANVQRLLEHKAKLANALVCAGVTAAREPGGAWETVDLVPDERKADPANGVLWVGALDAATRDALAEAVSGLLQEGLADRLARFRRKE